MRRLLALIAAATTAIALSWLPGAVDSTMASDIWLPQEPQLPAARLALACQVPKLPPKDLSKVPEIECRSAVGTASAGRPADPAADRRSA